jgi:tripartite-type tricarboxylate transporter receptor subunit TctC
MGPANMPKPIVMRLNAEINRALTMQELREKLSGEALETMPMSPEQFAAYIKSDIDKWSRLVKSRNIEIE